MDIKKLYHLVYDQIIMGLPCYICDQLYITPNMISLFRTLLIIPIYRCLFVYITPNFRQAFGIFLTSVILDSFDGVLARYQEKKYRKQGKPIKPLLIELNQQAYIGWLFQVGISDQGKLFDACMDKLLIIPLFYFFYLHYLTIVRFFGVMLTHLEIISLCLAVMKYYLAKNNPDQIQNTGSNIWGKLKMVTECVAFSFILCFTPDNGATMGVAQTLIICALPLAFMSVLDHLKAVQNI